MSLSREDVMAIVEAVVVSNTKVTQVMMGAIPLKAIAESVQSGLVFEVSASEVRGMLLDRAKRLRDRAEKREESRQPASKLTTSKLTTLADQAEWQAAHLVERTYRLSSHEVDALMREDGGLVFDFDPGILSTSIGRDPGTSSS